MVKIGGSEWWNVRDKTKELELFSFFYLKKDN
jgi:hypothetical protein